MLIFKKILCPTDFSEPSDEALKYAIELAVQFGAELKVLHVIPIVPPPPPGPNYVFDVMEYERILHEEAARKLEELIRERVPKEVKIQPIVEHGEAGHEIVRIAEDEAVGLIVIATHGLRGWRRLVFGSVAERVVRTAVCPVLTIRAPRQ